MLPVIRPSLILLCICMFKLSFGCLNGASMMLKDGTFLYEDHKGNIPFGHLFHSDEHFVRGVAQLDSLYKQTKDLDYLSDKGLLLILMKRYQEAIALYLDIEQQQPKHYSTASNLGTAYELAGQNEKALYWINKAIAIDPESHQHSEWIHANILKAKLSGNAGNDPASLVNTSFFPRYQQDNYNVLPETTLSDAELKALGDALYYQLNERVSFIEGKDPIVSRLLFTLADIHFLQKNYSDAITIYAMARDRAEESFHKDIDERFFMVARELSTHAEVSENRVSNIESYLRMESIYENGLAKRTRIIYLLCAICISITTVFIYFMIKKGRSRKPMQ